MESAEKLLVAVDESKSLARLDAETFYECSRCREKNFKAVIMFSQIEGGCQLVLRCPECGLVVRRDLASNSK